ncbi:MAG: DUF4349 domain-containing protein [Dehalococcoidia bacterium]|nr:DUF4349 domain-containing protein [Dehalococcoidia bacterium]
MAVRTLLLMALALFLMVVAACGGSEGPVPTSNQQVRDAQDAKGAPGSTGGGASTGTSVDRLIVRTVNLTMLVKDVAGTVETVATIASDRGGFVLSTQLTGEEDSRYGYISIRVPTEQTDAALAQLRGLAVRVETERSTAQDATEEYVDLESTLKNLEATEEQYLSLMKRATTVEDTLKVQKELTSIQGQIEQIKGRMQYLERTSATSLIIVEMRPATSPEPLVQPGWSPLETAKNSIRGLAGFGQSLADFAIALVIWSPVWVPAGIGGWFLMRWLSRMARDSGRGQGAGPSASGQTPTRPPSAPSDSQ